MRSARERLDEILRTPGFRGIAALDGDDCIGFAAGFTERWYDSRVFHLKEMCVLSARQQRGIGGEMLDTLLAELADSGVTSIYLLTVRDSRSEAFWERMGFAVSQRMIMMKRHCSVGRAVACRGTEE
jgi:N-acetylglutamate synthase-like GNAT family acetyltransferase